MKLLPNVVRSLKWVLKQGDGKCCLSGNCTKPTDRKGRLQLCPAHRREYRARQHRLAQAKVDARPVTAPRLKPMLTRRGKPTPWALANPAKAKKLRDARD